MSQWYEAKADCIEVDGDNLNILFDYEEQVAGNRYVVVKISDVLEKINLSRHAITLCYDESKRP